MFVTVPEKQQSEANQRTEWLAWDGKGYPPCNVSLAFICPRCGQVMHCRPKECKPKEKGR